MRPFGLPLMLALLWRCRDGGSGRTSTSQSVGEPSARPINFVFHSVSAPIHPSPSQAHRPDSPRPALDCRDGNHVQPSVLSDPCRFVWQLYGVLRLLLSCRGDCKIQLRQRMHRRWMKLWRKWLMAEFNDVTGSAASKKPTWSVRPMPM